MNLSPWRIIGLVVLAAVFFAVAILDVSAPAVPASCSGADSSRSHGLLTQAEEAYVAILAKEPDSGCARKGMKEVGADLCRNGKETAKRGGYVAAARLYNAILSEQPTNSINRDCALKGLRTVNAQAGSVTYTCPTHTSEAEGTCTVTVGARGDSSAGEGSDGGSGGKGGEGGKGGQGGKAGEPGKPGEPGKGGRGNWGSAKRTHRKRHPCKRTQRWDWR